MTKSAYPPLCKAGVRIFEYTPGFIHEKLLVSDDKYAIVGTVNLDYRSFVHHFEDALWMYGGMLPGNIRDEFLKTLTVCEEIEKKEAELSFFERMLRNIIRLFAPLL